MKADFATPSANWKSDSLAFPFWANSCSLMRHVLLVCRVVQAQRIYPIPNCLFLPKGMKEATTDVSPLQVIRSTYIEPWRIAVLSMAP